VLWKLCRGQILAPVGASSSSSVGTSASVASSASAAAVSASASASAVATAVAFALGLVAVPPAWRFGTVAVAVPVAVPVASPVVVSASAPSSTGADVGGWLFAWGSKETFFWRLGGLASVVLSLGRLEPEALVGSFVEALALGLGLYLAVLDLLGTEMERVFMR